MHRSVLKDRDFIRWANESLVVFVAHAEMGHEQTEEPGPYDQPVRRCTLYPGLACRDHVDASVDVDNARGDDLVKVPFLELCPNTWLVAPTGEVTPVEEKDQFLPAKVREAAEAVQKAAGTARSPKDFEAMAPVLAKADDALDAGRWREGLGRLADLEALGTPKGEKAPPAALRALIDARLASVEEDAAYDFEEARDDRKATPEAKRERIARIRDALDVVVLGSRVPTHAAAAAYLAR